MRLMIQRNYDVKRERIFTLSFIKNDFFSNDPERTYWQSENPTIMIYEYGTQKNS